MKSIYLLATERSGSNLVRVMLGNHSEIAAPLPANCFKNCYENLIYYKYGSKIDYVKVIEDIVSIVNHPFSQWNINSTPNYIFNKYTPDSLVKCFSAVYSEYADNEGKNAFISKDIANITFAPFILLAEPEAKFIYLCRDPRDVVSSRVRGGIFSSSVYQNALLWRKEQQTCLAFQCQFPKKVHIVRYEDLITNTERTVGRILDFLELERQSACHNTGKTGQHLRHEQSELWENLSKPIINDNSKKYKLYLKETDINIIESVTKNQMIYLGYKDFDTNADYGYKMKRWYYLKDQIKKPLHRLKLKFHMNKKSKYMREKIHFMHNIREVRQMEWIKENNSFTKF